MIGRGRASADAIAHGQVAEAGVSARDAGGLNGCDGAMALRFAALARACEHLSGGAYSLPRGLGLPGVLALREAAFHLREDCCGLVASAGPGPLYLAAIRTHQSMDAAATALGAAPDCFADPDDWSLDDEEAPVPLGHLAATARTAALVCHGLDDLLAGAGAPGAMMRRDAAILVGGCLVLQAVCLDPAGIRPAIARSLAESTRASADRVASAAAAWRAADPGGRIDRLGEAIEGAGRLASDVLDDLRGCGAPAP